MIFAKKVIGLGIELAAGAVFCPVDARTCG